MDFTEIFKNIGGIKSQVEALKQKMARIRVTGEAGAGLVKVTMNGESNVIDVKIDPTILSADSKDICEELLMAATNDALKKTREAMAYEMKSMTGIPGLDKLFG